jgi:hypothetical protein
MARPRKEIDWKIVEELALIQCTQKEIAHVIGIHEDTLTSRKEFFGIYKKGKEEGKTSLRRLQWKSAQKGNVTMQIFLGKQYLDQRDKQFVENDMKLTWEQIVQKAKQQGIEESSE